MDLKKLREIEYRLVSEPDFSLTYSQIQDLIYLSKKALLAWEVFTGLDTMDHAAVMEALERRGQLPPGA